MENTLSEFVKIVKNHSIYVESIIEIGSRDGLDADFLKKSFDVSPENVHIIEPNPKFIEDLRIYPYKIHEIAISNDNGTSVLHQMNTDIKELDGISSILYRPEYDLDIYNVKRINVITQTAYDFIKTNGIKDFIVKLDVEGLTYQVLESFKELIEEIKAIHLETEEFEIWQNQKTTHEVFEFLSSNFIRVLKKRISKENEYIQYDEIWVNKNHFKYTIDNYFDKVFYINLDNDITRKEKLLSQLNKYNIRNVERIRGSIIQEVPDYYYWRNFNIQFLTKKYVIGSLGARNAHWRIMELSIQRNYERILILEDDILIHQDPNHILDINKNSLDRWDMLYFGGLVEHEFGGQIVCAHAYGVNRKIMQETYHMLPSSGMEVDNFYAKIIHHMSYNYNRTGKYDIVKMMPFNTITQADTYESNIKP